MNQKRQTKILLLVMWMFLFSASWQGIYGYAGILENGVPILSTLAGSGDAEVWEINVDPGALSMRVFMDCIPVDYDIYGSNTTVDPSYFNCTFMSMQAGGEDYTFPAPEAGSWFIKVESYDGSGPYTLEVYVTYESQGGGGNDSYVLTSGQTVNSSLPDQYSYEIWQIEVPEDSAYIQVVIDCPFHDFEFIASYMNPNPDEYNMVFGGFAGGGENEIYAYPQAGTWYIKVYAYYLAGVNGEYSITVTVSEEDPADSYPELQGGEPVIDSLSYENDFDHWKIEVGENATALLVVLQSGICDFDYYASHETPFPDGDHFEFTDYSPSAGDTVIFENPGSGTWYFRLQTSYEEGAYRFLVFVQYGSEGDPAIPAINNNSVKKATLNGTGDYDLWKVNIADNARSIRLILNSGSSDYNLYASPFTVNPEAGNNVIAGCKSGSENEFFTNPMPGTWYVKVQSAAGSGLYTLAVSVDYSTTGGPEGPQYVVINEFLPDPLPGAQQWIELYNPTNSRVNIKGFWLEIGEGYNYKFKYDTYIPARDFLLVYYSESGLYLDKTGTTVRFKDPGYVTLDEMSYTSCNPGVSFGRTSDGGSSWGSFFRPTCNTSNMNGSLFGGIALTDSTFHGTGGEQAQWHTVFVKAQQRIYINLTWTDHFDDLDWHLYNYANTEIPLAERADAFYPADGYFTAASDGLYTIKVIQNTYYHSLVPYILEVQED